MFRWGVWAVLGLVACSEDVPPAGFTPVECAAGFGPAADSLGCVPVLPEQPCPAGFMAIIGETECQPVGWVVCPAGFSRDLSGWGCVDALPAQPCAAPTRDAVGQSNCQPVGNCGGAFPPGDATLFVNGAFTAGELDATHFLTINEAVSAAAPGAVIAVHDGTYTETLNIPVRMSLVGRCAENVILESAGADTPGILAAGRAVTVRDMTVRGHLIGVEASAGGQVTLDAVILTGNRDLGLGVFDPSSTATVSGSLIRDGVPNAGGMFGWGITVEGATLNISDSAIVHNTGLGIAVTSNGGIANVSRTVIRDTLADDQTVGMAVAVQTGGRAIVDQSVLVESTYWGVLVEGSGSSASITDTLIRDTRLDTTGNFGVGVDVRSGARVEVLRSAIVRNKQVGAQVQSVGSELELHDSVIRDTGATTGGIFGYGAAAQFGGTLVLNRSAVIHNREQGVFTIDPGTSTVLSESLVHDTLPDTTGDFGRGVAAEFGAQLALTRSALEGNHEYGAFIAGDGPTGPAQLTMTHTLVRGTIQGPAASGGIGVNAQDGGSLVIDGSAVLDNTAVGVFVTDSRGSVTNAITRAVIDNSVIAGTRLARSGTQGAGIVCGGVLTVTNSRIAHNHTFGVVVANPTSSGHIENSVILATALEGTGEFGHGILAGSDAHLNILSSDVRASAGIGLAFTGGSAMVGACVVANNAVGIHTQGGSVLIAVDERPEEIGPTDVVVLEDTRFEGNAARVGSGEVPLPNPVEWEN